MQTRTPKGAMLFIGGFLLHKTNQRAWHLWVFWKRNGLLWDQISMLLQDLSSLVHFIGCEDDLISEKLIHKTNETVVEHIPPKSKIIWELLKTKNTFPKHLPKSTPNLTKKPIHRSCLRWLTAIPVPPSVDVCHAWTWQMPLCKRPGHALACFVGSTRFVT